MNKYIKTRFPFFSTNEGTTYLDSAASSLKLGSVTNALNEYYQASGVNIHRGVYKLAYEATEKYEETRKLVSDFLNSEVDEVIFTKGTTDSLNKVAKSYGTFINDGDEIITSELEHHSSFLPWQEIANEKNAKLVFIPLNKGRITVDGFKKVITNKTKVVAITYVSNVLGYKTPIKEITKLAHEVGAIVILDAAQAVSHIKIDVKDMDVDFLAFSAHKMYGPNGVGVLYGKKALLEKLPPFEYGGEMVHTVSKDKSTWKDIPYKFEAGTPVIGEVIAFSEAIDFINEIGIDNICKQEMELKDYTVSKLKTIQGVKVYNPDADNPIIAFNIDNVHPHDVTSVLDQNNVCIRAGHHCAQLAIKYLNEIATLRASFGVYNTLEDCDKFLEAVKMASDFFKKF